MTIDTVMKISISPDAETIGLDLPDGLAAIVTAGPQRTRKHTTEGEHRNEV